MKRLIKKEDIDNVAKELLSVLKPSKTATVMLLEGDLGAGKTTLVQAIAKALGVMESVVSPTFVIQKRYSVNHEFLKSLIHIDAYRLASGKDIEKLGWSDWVKSSQNIIIVEWPSLIEEVIPSSVYRVSIDHVDEETRNIKITHED